jgi:hypothetical protein
VSSIVLRGGVEVDDPLRLALDFLEAYAAYETAEASAPMSFDEDDLRRANRGGARISAAEIAATLERRDAIERALRRIPSATSLAGDAGSVPWLPLTRLFDAFAGIRGVGFSKMTKALHPKRPALIPMLDSVVQAHLRRDEPSPSVPRSFGEDAIALVRSYKRELDANRSALRAMQRELARRDHLLSEVRILDLVIWSVFAGRSGGAV